MKYVTEARLHAIITGTRAGTWEWRVDGDELLVNDRWAEMLGYQHDELAPYSLHTWTQLAHPSDRDRFEDQLKGFRTSSPPPLRGLHHPAAAQGWQLAVGTLARYVHQGS